MLFSASLDISRKLSPTKAVRANEKHTLFYARHTFSISLTTFLKTKRNMYDTYEYISELS
jgi:hypothetical protein